VSPVSRRFDAVIAGACRTPIGSFGGSLKQLTAPDLGAIVIGEALRRAHLSPADAGEVILGCVLQAGAGMNVARQAAIRAGLPVSVPAETVNRVCGSGLTAVVHAVEAIQCGYTDTVVAGGTESMSNAPYLLTGARWGYRMGHATVTDSMLAEGLTCALEGCHMGVTAEEVARKYAVSRSDQDAFALESQRRAARALADGSFTAEIVPVSVTQKKGDAMTVAVDEYPRPDTSLDRLSALKPAFEPEGTVTAGNASGINDGAAALVVTTESNAKKAGSVPLARVVSYAAIGVEPRFMGIGPVPAISRALERAGIDASEVDLFEMNEAFAAQSVAVIRELHLDPAKVNVNGGAIALGHPIGATGARILTTLIYALRARQRRIGVASLCIGGGMGIAMVVEAM